MPIGCNVSARRSFNSRSGGPSCSPTNWTWWGTKAPRFGVSLIGVGYRVSRAGDQFAQRPATQNVKLRFQFGSSAVLPRFHHHAGDVVVLGRIADKGVHVLDHARDHLA